MRRSASLHAHVIFSGSTMAVDVCQPVSVRRPGSRVGDHVALGDCLAGGREPLLPLLGADRFAVGVEQVALTQIAASVLLLKQTESAAVQWRSTPAPPPGPIVGQRRIIG